MVNVVDASETVTGTDVVKVVKVEVRDPGPEPVALDGMGEVCAVSLEAAAVAEDVGVVEGIAEVTEVAEEFADGDEAVTAEDVCVGKKTEPSLVVHHCFLGEGSIEESS